MNKHRILTERLFLRSPNINVCFRIKIAGSIGKERFETAMRGVCKRHPLLNCSIEIDKNNNAWFVPGEGRIGIEYYQPDEMPDWRIWHEKTDVIPFDFMRGPLIRLCVISGGNQAEIIVLGHHIIGDGIGYLNLSKDILLALDNRLEAHPQELPANNKFKNGGRLGFLLKLYARKLNNGWKKSPANFSEDEYGRFFHQYRGKYIPKMYMDSLDEESMKRLIEKRKNSAMTVNELLTTAFSGAMVIVLGNYPKNKIRIGIVINTRNELAEKPYHNYLLANLVSKQVNYCMGNYVTGISVIAHYNSGNDFISNAKNISSIIRKKLTNAKARHLIVNFLNEFDSGLIESIMYASYGNYKLPVSKKIGDLIGEGTQNKNLGMSNLGKYEFNDYETFKFLDMQFIGPTFPANLVSASIITVNNKLNICLRYNENVVNAKAIKRIYEKTMDLLDI